MKQWIQVLGNIGSDATVRKLDSGAIAIQFNVAVTEKYKDKLNTSWYGCTVWRTPTQGDNVSQYFRKGDKILVEGRPAARAYTNKAGELVASLEINVNNFIFLSTKQAGEQKQQAEQPAEQQLNSDGYAVDPEDLPF